MFTSTFNDPFQVIVLLSDGKGGLIPQAPVDAGGHPWLQLTVGDFNNNGNVDAAITHVFDNSMGVLLGDGRGGLAPVQSYPTGENPYAIDAADIDGDGDLELVTSNFGSADWTIYENTGQRFVNPRTLSSSQAGTCAVLHDRDGDGDIDLTGFDETGDWIYFYTNGAAANPTRPPHATITLEQNQPNPFNPQTSIRFNVSRDVQATVSVYDAAGRFVTRIASGLFTTGSHDARWNGTDAKGSRVASGVYFYRLEAENTQLTRKMVLLR